jgi:3-hydroxyacyl-CoA dehydrogenase/enoyl-CoA hydratase/3-hydroxybutyryl-CoA epimerase
MGVWTLDKLERIHVLTIDDPDRPVNILTVKVLKELEKMIDRVAKKPPAALVITGVKPDMFVAGADVNEIAAVQTVADARKFAHYGQSVFQKIAELRCVTVAAINGVCLGGGTELALACDYRIMSDAPAAQIGLPEIQLGIIPGFGGTARLQARVGLKNALDLILKGSRIPARRAKKQGLVDLVLPHRGFAAAALTAVEAWLDGNHRPEERSSGVMDYMLEDTGPGRSLVFNEVEKKTRSQAEHYPAISAAIRVMRNTHKVSVREALAIEAGAVSKLADTSTARSLIRLYQVSESLKGQYKVRNLSLDQGVVLGAGVMGGGIAQLLADNRIPVRIRQRGRRIGGR